MKLTVPEHRETDKGAEQRFAEAKRRLLLRVQNRTLVEAAEALAANRLGAAETLLATYLKSNPSDAHALSLMADIARRENRFDHAEQLLSECVTLSPDTEGFRYNYAVVLRRLHKYEEALTQLNALLGNDPTNVLYRDQKAGLLTAIGRHAEAIVCRRALVEEFSRSPDMLVRYAHALREAGLQTECVAAYRKTLDVEPAFEAVYSNLAGLKVYQFTEQDIAAMEGQVRSAAISAANRAGLHHALGRAYGDLKRHNRSFENYAKSNALRRIHVDFDIERRIAARKACEALFTGGFFRERTGWGCDSRGPIFIVGMPRSGSTLLEQILCSHSAIEGLGELQDLETVFIRRLAPFQKLIRLGQLTDGDVVDATNIINAYMTVISGLGADELAYSGKLYLESTGRQRLTERPFFTDKALGNYFYVGLIHLILPNCKIVDIRRHPLDCGWSCFKSQFPGMHFSLKLTDIGQEYVNYAQLMAHFDKVLPGRIHRVRYEQLVADPEAELERLFKYLDLPMEDACLRFYENRRPLKTQSSEQVRMPLFRDGVDQWRPYEQWLGPLKAALGPILESYPAMPA